ncbi:hypothetical protein [Dongia rigui]|uniref:Uncharacterized protein n=1 Tax=Dongia rigui TaxID=940149 RepID=A0ABU5E0R8_9PROT|nr:hypothetical protein [Dongia rigui]MDY0873135.1 hypothetical protein [Dongia rigui]
MTQDILNADRTTDSPPSTTEAESVNRRSFHIRYAAMFFSPMLVVVVIVGALYAFLWRTLETIGPVTAARLQDKTGDLYGAALFYRPFAYKLERYRLTSPDILLVGSSRVMQFAGEVFNVPVLNSGGASNTLDQTVGFIRAALAVHKPKAILIGLDFWWFNPSRDDDIDATGDMSDDVDLSLSQLFAPLQWVSEGSLRAGSFFEALLPVKDLAPGIGAFAKFGGRGWDVYGRYDYGTLLDGGMQSDDRHFKRTLKRLQSAKISSKLNVRVSPSAEKIDELRQLLAELDGQSIEVVLFLPPLAGSVLQAIEQDPESRLIPLWRDAMANLGARVFDFTDPQALGSNDCEFVDGFHGGAVTYMRILDAIADYGDTILSRAIDRDMVAGLIATNAGHARVNELLPGDAPPEIDFLDLGCPKAL